jgi:RNA polymerase sigma-70 factor (ECF subfamily)
VQEPQHIAEHFFRHESARLVASLTRAFGTRHLNLVEDVVQSALVRALSSWSHQGVPAEPAAWLRQVARNLVIDALRRDLRWNALDASKTSIAVNAPELPMDAQEIADDLLRMIFVCCDDVVPAESQVALALKTLCGFGVKEIARAFLTTEANVTRRITRAKDKLRSAGLNPSDLTATQVRERLPRVFAVLYLLFNEGYSSTQRDQLIREDLCEEAVRLALLLAEHPLTRGPESAAFLALLLFHAGRLEARIDAGGMLLLEDQDRSRWNRRLIAEGFRWFTRSAAGDVVTRYHAEAWIAAEHCRARTFAETDWDRIVRAYDVLIRLAPSPVHELNRAIALAARDGADAGWRAFLAIDARAFPEQFHLWAATAGELCQRRGDHVQARVHFLHALEHAPTNAEQDLLRKRLELLGLIS